MIYNQNKVNFKLQRRYQVALSDLYESWIE